MSIKEALEARGNQLAQAVNSGDAESASRLYTEDALLMPPGSPQLQGRAAIREAWQGMIDAGVKDLEFTCHEAVEAGDTAIEVSALSASASGEGGSPVSLVGKYIVIWKKGGDGDWYLHRDIWNLDA